MILNLTIEEFYTLNNIGIGARFHTQSQNYGLGHPPPLDCYRNKQNQFRCVHPIQVFRFFVEKRVFFLKNGSKTAEFTEN